MWFISRISCWRGSGKVFISLKRFRTVRTGSGEDWRPMELSKEFVEKFSELFFNNDIAEEEVKFKDQPDFK